MKQNEIVLFETQDNEIKIPVRIEQENVWLNRNQIAELFGRDVKTIGKHISNALKEELEPEVVVAKFATTTQHGAIEGKTQTHQVEYYNLDMIISVGYRVKSARGVEFRRWANNVLKQYIMQGYALNEKRLIALQKTVEIQSKMIANTLEIDTMGVLQAVNQYTKALTLLDQYDHKSIEKPEGNAPLYRITYKDCRKIIDSMDDRFSSAVFGTEKEPGKVEGIIAAVYQNVFGQELYATIEEKAANLLYFMVKDHPFNDGCKRIAASLFLEFLNRNRALYRNGNKIISDGTLVAITLMIAESDPKEKDIMTAIVMNLLKL